MRFFPGLLVSLVLVAPLAPCAHGQQQSRSWGTLMELMQKRREDARKIEAAAPGVTTRLDVGYLDDKDPLHKLDVYLPASKEPVHPILMHIHGGGWEIGDKKLMKTTGVFYASREILFVTPNYRLSPAAQHPAHVEDCAAALAWTFAHAAELHGDRRRIYVSGHSAGAHLAALLGTDAAYLKPHGLKPTDLAGVIPVDAATFDLLDDGNETIVKKFIHDSFGDDRAVLKSASPFCHLSRDDRYPPFLVLNTTNRQSAANGARLFAEKLKTVHGNMRFVPVDNHTHGEMASGMYVPTDPVGSAILKFIAQGANRATSSGR